MRPRPPVYTAVLPLQQQPAYKPTRSPAEAVEEATQSSEGHSHHSSCVTLARRELRQHMYTFNHVWTFDLGSGSSVASARYAWRDMLDFSLRAAYDMQLLFQ